MYMINCNQESVQAVVMNLEAKSWSSMPVLRKSLQKKESGKEVWTDYIRMWLYLPELCRINIDNSSFITGKLI